MLTPGYSLGAPFGPGAENLQLLLDYENWTAGDPLPNVYPDNSGITSLTDNNTVEAETTSPLIGSKSGKYLRSDNEFHSIPPQAWPVNTKDFYFALFVEKTVDNFQSHISVTSTQNDAGADFSTSDPDNNKSLRLATESTQNGRNVFSTPITDGRHFVEGWYTHNDGNAHLRIDDGNVAEGSLPAPDESNIELTIGKIVDNSTNGGPVQTFDMILFELADPGTLFWPDHATFLYNGGAGRSSDEILNYDP